MKKINKAWHGAHVMPKHASYDQRVAWHMAHQENCGCRPVPAKLLQEMAQKNTAK